MQSQNGIIGIQSALINPYTWNIPNITTYAVLGFAYPVCVYRTKNGDMLIGSTGPNAGVYGLIRTDSLFNVKWTQYCPGGAEHILEDSLGNILVSGSNVSQALKPFILNYFDSAGNLIWNRYYGDNVNFTGNILAANILLLPDSNFLLVGEGSLGAAYHFAKIERATGDTIYTRNLSYYYPRMALQISGDNIFTCSNKDFNFYNTNGDLLYSKPFPMPFPKFQASHAINTIDGGIVVAGVTVPGNNNNVRLPTLIKIDTLGNSMPLSISDFEKINSQFTVYPNPVSGELHFYLPALLAQQDVIMSVYDATGRLVISANQINRCENETCTLDCSALNNGFYSMVIQGKEG
ncbi:MAG: T9SS type A sorting domain-containing protein [Bacteroidetes bacterium]|nr:T9SS type A sorting domain-containing protein [Bacteroidota bacterium]